MYQTWDCGFVPHSLYMGFIVDKPESGELCRGCSCFPLPQISVHHFFTLISLISFHLPLRCYVSGMISWHACYLHPLNKWGFITSHPLTWHYICHELTIFILFSIGKSYYDISVPCILVFAGQNSYCKITQFLKTAVHISHTNSMKQGALNVLEIGIVIFY